MGGTHPTGMHSCVLCFQLENMVPREKLDQAYLELDHALRREQRAQQLLKEQGEQLNGSDLRWTSMHPQRCRKMQH